MEFFRQECWSQYPSPFPGDRPDLEIKPRSPALQADSLPSESPGKPVMNIRTTQFSDVSVVKPPVHLSSVLLVWLVLTLSHNTDFYRNLLFSLEI